MLYLLSMTLETRPNRQNPIQQILKRTVGIESYQQNRNRTPTETKLNCPQKLSRAIFYGSSGFVQLLFPLMTESTNKKNTLLDRNNAIIGLTILLDLGVVAGTTFMVMTGEHIIAGVVKTGYNLMAGALNESLERRELGKK